MGYLRPLLSLLCVLLVAGQLAILFLDGVVELPWGMSDLSRWAKVTDSWVPNFPSVDGDAAPDVNNSLQSSATTTVAPKGDFTVTEKPSATNAEPPSVAPTSQLAGKPDPRESAMTKSPVSSSTSFSNTDRTPSPSPAATNTVTQTTSTRFSAENRIQSVGLESYIRSVSVRIQNLTTGKTASGVIFARQDEFFDVLTVAHLLSENCELAVTQLEPASQGDSNRFQQVSKILRELKSVTVLKSDPRFDLALLRTQTPLFSGDEFATISPVIPHEIDADSWDAWSIDCTTDGETLVRQAEIVGVVRLRPTKTMLPSDFLQVRGVSAPGMSGSGMFDPQGRVVGIASGNSRGHAYYVASSMLRQFIESGESD